MFINKEINTLCSNFWETELTQWVELTEFRKVRRVFSEMVKYEQIIRRSQGSAGRRAEGQYSLVVQGTARSQGTTEKAAAIFFLRLHMPPHSLEHYPKALEYFDLGSDLCQCIFVTISLVTRRVDCMEVEQMLQGY